MHIIIQEQFQSESLKEFKQKDIDLQYILMCEYILEKNLLQPNTLNKLLLFCHTINNFIREKKEFCFINLQIIEK